MTNKYLIVVDKPLDSQVSFESDQFTNGFSRSCIVALVIAVMAVDTVLKLPEYTAAVKRPGMPGMERYN